MAQTLRLPNFPAGHFETGPRPIFIGTAGPIWPSVGAPALAGIGVVVAQENTRPRLSAGGCSLPERLDLVRNPCRPCLTCRRLAASPASAPASPPPSARW